MATAPSFTQVGKPMRLTTPLGADVLLLERLTGDEAVSKPFELTLELLSTNTGLDPKDILRKPVTVEVDLVDGSTRYFNGVVRRFVQLGRAQGLVTYRAEVVPTIWLLSLSADCKVYQTKSVPDIVKAVLDDAGIKDYRFSITGTPPTRDYCVQYRETHLDFISRLLEEEGISYYFEHAKDKHTIVFINAATSIKATPISKLSMNRSTIAGGAVDSILELEVGADVSSGKVSLADYNDTVPKRLQTSIPASAQAFTASSLSVFDYPGKFAANDEGERIARLRMDELEALSHTVKGRTNHRGLASGQKLTVADHYRTDANIAYQLLSLQHQGTVGDYQTGGGEAFSFESAFIGIPASATYRPPRVTPKSIVHGAQTAVVVGPSGEEIYVDKYGRVKVQFFWDQVGTNDEKSSCWVRVSSTWAGKQWGFIQIPRIGQEVIVDFLEGDPDRPIITGRVYNGDMMPPYALPANGTQSGLKTRSSKAGAATDANELRFEDKKGSEEVYLHSQKDFNALTENDETWKVQHDRTTTIKNNETKTVTEGDEATTIAKGNQTLTVSKGNQTIAVSEGDQTLTVDKGKQTITVEGDRTITIKTGNDSLTVNTGNQTNTIKTGNLTTEVDTGNHGTTVKMGNFSIKASLGAISGEAMQSISLKVGSNSITIDQTGITIKGMQIAIEGQIQTEIKSVMTTVKGDGMLTLKGGVTMIN